MNEEPTGNEYRQQRIENMNQLAAAGFPAFGKAFERTARLDELHADFEEGRQVKVCGRIVAIRKMGKMAFAHISDGSATVPNVYASVVLTIVLTPMEPPSAKPSGH